MMYWWAVLPFCKGIASATHIDAVNHGQYAALQYLFEAVGLFPADIQNETQQQDVLASNLVARRWDCLKFLFRTTRLRKIPRKVNLGIRKR